jgi:cytochrome c biogenesis protein CcmG/thiol:disulfide interchange protein DsbE
VALFLGLALIFAVGMWREDPDGLPSQVEGRSAPPLELAALPGKPTFTGETLRSGGIKLVNFWASWCVPCRVEHPALERLAAEGLPIYGVNYKDEPAKALAFLEELGDPYAALGADPGRNAIEWGVYGVPETYVIDGDGTVLLRFAGPITNEVLENRIRPVLKEASN